MTHVSKVTHHNTLGWHTRVHQRLTRTEFVVLMFHFCNHLMFLLYNTLHCTWSDCVFFNIKNYFSLFLGGRRSWHTAEPSPEGLLSLVYIKPWLLLIMKKTPNNLVQECSSSPSLEWKGSGGQCLRSRRHDWQQTQGWEPWKLLPCWSPMGAICRGVGGSSKVICACCFPFAPPLWRTCSTFDMAYTSGKPSQVWLQMGFVGGKW